MNTKLKSIEEIREEREIILRKLFKIIYKMDKQKAINKIREIQNNLIK